MEYKIKINKHSHSMLVSLHFILKNHWRTPKINVTQRKLARINKKLKLTFSYKKNNFTPNLKNSIVFEFFFYYYVCVLDS